MPRFPRQVSSRGTVAVVGAKVLPSTRHATSHLAVRELAQRSQTYCFRARHAMPSGKRRYLIAENIYKCIFLNRFDVACHPAFSVVFVYTLFIRSYLHAQSKAVAAWMIRREVDSYQHERRTLQHHHKNMRAVDNNRHWTKRQTLAWIQGFRCVELLLLLTQALSEFPPTRQPLDTRKTSKSSLTSTNRHIQTQASFPDFDLV